MYKLHYRFANSSPHLLAPPQQVAGDSVDIADRQPAFLKDKGDALFKQV